MTEYAKPKKS